MQVDVNAKRPPSLWFAVSAVLALLVATTAHGQQRELTTADRLAILYAPQLDFTDRGDPTVRIGLIEGRNQVSFTPSKPIRVMPRADRGAEIELPARREYTVSISDSEAGAYEHWVVVDDLTLQQRDRVEEIEQTWRDRGYTPERFQVGGLFGIRGNVFDSRRILIGVGGVETHEKARELRDELVGAYGIEGRIHSELTEYPGGLLTLTGAGTDIEIRHRDVMWIGPADGETDAIEYRVPDVPTARGKDTETRTYSGRLIVSPDRDGSIALINKIGSSRLLKGVVPSETYPSAPEPALRAQAVAARNTIFSAIGVRNLADPYMLRSDVYDQVYAGVESETSRTSKAVEATRGEVLFHGKHIIEAVYSANAGGYTEHNANVWNAEPRPYLRGRPDAPRDEVPERFRDGIDDDEVGAFLDSQVETYAGRAPMGTTHLYRWEETVSAGTAVDWLQDHGRDIDRIRDLEVTERGVSGRAVRLEVTGAGGATTEVLRELNIRRFFGGLKSALFEMELRRRDDGTVASIEFRGGGYGHGVGMCQTGAIGMADAGKSYREILHHYYKGVEIRELY